MHRQKFKNVERDPRVTLTIWEREDPYRFVEVRGEVVGITLEGSEQYALRSQIARDLGRYDFIKDIGRVESSVADRAPRARGYAILLTNDPSYWKHPRSDNTADARFRLHEGNILRGSLGWGSGASEGTKRGREDLLQLRGSYILRWEDYSRPAGDNYGKFRYLVVEAKGGASTTIAEPSLAGTHWVHDDEEALGLGTDDYARVRAEEQCVLGLRRITRTICHNTCRHFLSTMVLSENTARGRRNGSTLVTEEP